MRDGEYKTCSVNNLITYIGGYTLVCLFLPGVEVSIVSVIDICSRASSSCIDYRVYSAIIRPAQLDTAPGAVPVSPPRDDDADGDTGGVPAGTRNSHNTDRYRQPSDPRNTPENSSPQLQERWNETVGTMSENKLSKEFAVRIQRRKTNERFE